MKIAFPIHAAPKKRLHRCSVCDRDFEWSELSGSCYYGGFIVHKLGQPDGWEEEKIIAKMCSRVCRTKYEQLHPECKETQ